MSSISTINDSNLVGDPTPNPITDPAMVFVFGSNEQGKHNGGAARTANEKHGAEYHVGFGHKGNSFAIPTCSRSTSEPNFEITPDTLRFYIYCFILYAKLHPELTFQVTRIGTGLAGWTDAVVAPLFAEAPDNCYFDSEWDGTDPSGNVLLPGRKYWGSYGKIALQNPTPGFIAARDAAAVAATTPIDANDPLSLTNGSN